jgi:hypothetical protein
MLEIKNEDIFFEEDNSPEATDRKIIQTNIDHLNGLKTALDRNALSHSELLRNSQVFLDAAQDRTLKKVLKILIKDELLEASWQLSRI